MNPAETAPLPDTPLTPYNPFLRHRRLCRQTVPSLGWRGGDFAAWQAAARKQLAHLLGLDRMFAQERPDLNVRSLWTQAHPLGSIEKIVFTSEPECDVPAYVCIPHGFRAPGPFFICLHGHSTGMHNSIAVDFNDETKPIHLEKDRDYALGCMRRGIAALCIEQRAFGERRDILGNHRVGCHNAAMNALMLGRTLIGERVYDVDRALDYLWSREDVDRTRIGVMGSSGSGTVTMFSGGLLARATHLMPSCCFSRFADSIMSLHHCVCNYVPDLLLSFEMADIAALAAPKPLVVVNGEEDAIFPIGAARSEFARLQSAYAAAGAPSQCRHVIGDAGHRFYADAAWPVMLSFLPQSS